MRRHSGYIAPENVEYATTCFKIQIPDNPAYRAAFYGAITELQWAHSWDTDGDAEKAANIATFWRHLIFDADDGCTEESESPMLGVIIPVALESLPANMLWCDGQIYNRVDYPALYDALDAHFKISPNTFQVPDLRQRFVLGSETVGEVGGESEHALSIAELPAHTHTGVVPPHSHPIPVREPGAAFGTGHIAVQNNVNANGSRSTDVVPVPLPFETDARGGDGAHNNMPPYYTLRYAIIAG